MFLPWSIYFSSSYDRPCCKEGRCALAADVAGETSFQIPVADKSSTGSPYWGVQQHLHVSSCTSTGSGEEKGSHR